jgi:FAD/FMN-containing dehydrogenase/Fe-S oxidoreductase
VVNDVVAALRRAGVAEVDDSSLARALYSSDASLYRVPPRVVVRPRDVDELLATVSVSAETRTPLTLRGAGTSMAGNAVGTGIVVDTSRHLNALVSVDRDRRTARVQPGIVHAALQRQVKPLGLRFGPDPASHSRCTIGGMIGNNACGARALGYGRTVDNLVDLDVVTIAGERLQWRAGVSAQSPTLDRVAAVVDEDLSTVRTEFGRFGRQVSGYALEHLLPEHDRRVDRLLVGSEGTLAVVLGATVKLVEDPPHRALAVLGFDSMADAADAAPALCEHELVACEGMDGRILDVLRRRKGDAGLPELPRGKAWAMAEVTADSPEEARARAERVAKSVDCVDRRVFADEAEVAAVWRVREDGAGLTGQALARPSHAGWEDAAVPPDRLGDYLRDFDALMNSYRLDGLPYGHLGEGCMHIRINFELAGADGLRAFREFVTEAARLVASYGGTLSGEHGDGRARSELLPAMYSPRALGLFAAVKHVFDPDNLLNPGVLVDPAPVDADVRLARPLVDPAGRLMRLPEDDGSFLHAAHRCTGIGKCRADNTGNGGVMCPSYLATGEEKDSTRGRARVLQEMLNGEVVDDGWESQEVHEALDLCLACKGCARDCPTGIDMATYKAEALYQRYRDRLRPRSHYTLGRLPQWARLTQPVAPLANRMLRLGPVQKVARFAAGIDQRRGIPPFSPVSLSRWARRRDQAAADVVIWADSFTDSFSADAGRAAVALLEGAGLRVGVVGRGACCGLTWISTGQLPAARAMLRRTLRILDEYVSAGIPVVGLEPSCLATLRSDAVELVGGDQATRVAAGVRSLAEVLSGLQGYRPPDLSGVSVVAQPHCHHASIIGWEADEALLRRAGAEVTRVGGCCGLAGNFGVEKGHYEVSVAVAETALLPAVRRAGEGAVVLADGFSCRTQLDDLAGVRSVHLAELLTGSF